MFLILLKDTVKQNRYLTSYDHKTINKDYSLASDKLEIKNEMCSDYQLKVDYDYIIFIGNVKKLVPNFFNKEKYVLHYKNSQLYLRLVLKIKKKYIVYQNLINQNG